MKEANMKQWFTVLGVVLLAAGIAASSMAKELPQPGTPSPGLRCCYPVPKVASPAVVKSPIIGQ